MLIYIIRHGETEANRQGLLQGWTDYPLNADGVALAEETGRAMRDVRFDAAFTSPLLRARQTAECLLRESGNGDVALREDARLKEIFCGDWEMHLFRPDAETEDGFTENFTREDALVYVRDPARFRGFPGGESVRTVCSRTQGFLKELAARAGEFENVLVSTHGFALRAMLNFLYEDPGNFWHGRVPYNCAVNVVEVREGTLRLIADDRIYYDPAKIVDRYELRR